jgi:hypothetical protein
MIRFFTRARSRVLGGVAVAAAALVPAGVVSLTSESVHAAGCSTAGHVYLTSVSPSSFRFENQAIPGSPDDYQQFAGGPVSFRVGGNGLRPGTTPYWTISSTVTGTYAFFGRPAGSNCVANETWVTIPRYPVAGEVWTVTTNYDTGNTGRSIQNQSHFRITYNARPSFPQLPCLFCR